MIVRELVDYLMTLKPDTRVLVSTNNDDVFITQNIASASADTVFEDDTEFIFYPIEFTLNAGDSFVILQGE